jgi:hypothetical protein
MYLDVLDILNKNGYATKVEKDSGSAKNSLVFTGERLCGEVWVVSGASLLDEQKEKARGMFNFIEGSQTDAYGNLWYYGYTDNAHWVTMVDEKFPDWKDANPIYLQLTEKMEKSAKIKPTSKADIDKMEHDLENTATAFDKIQWYRDCRVLVAGCRQIITEKKDDIYQKALKKLAKLAKSKGDSSKHFREMVEAYTTLADQFEMLIPFDESEKRHEECLVSIEENKNEEIIALYIECEEDLLSLQKEERKITASATAADYARMVEDYERLMSDFKRIPAYKDSTEKAELCAAQITKFQKYQTIATYKEATADLEQLEAREDKHTWFEYTYRWRKYKSLARRFRSVSTYDDATHMSKKCAKIARSNRWRSLKKSAPALGIFILIILLILWLRSCGSDDGVDYEQVLSSWASSPHPGNF